MEVKTTLVNGAAIAVVHSKEPLFEDVQGALDFMMTVQYGTGSSRILLNKAALPGGFFILSNGMAGGILQKFVNYHMKLAIVGDYSAYTSKPLRDFIHESNRGRDIFFVSTEEDGLEKLSRAE